MARKSRHAIDTTATTVRVGDLWQFINGDRMIVLDVRHPVTEYEKGLLSEIGDGRIVNVYLSPPPQSYRRPEFAQFSTSIFWPNLGDKLISRK